MIRDCALNYLDTLPTNVNELPGTEDPWDISDSSDSDFASGHNHNYKIQSGSTDNTSLAASYGATTTDLQEMESFYINWRKNFEKWLFIKNPEKYGEFKNFLKFNSNTATSNSFGGSDVSDFESSPSSSPRRHANFNHPSNITFGGNPLVCAVANHVIERVTEENFLKHVEISGEYLQQQLNKKFVEPYSHICTAVKGKGLMVGLEFKQPPKELVKQCQENGLLVITAGKSTLRFVPALNIKQEEIDEGLAILEAAFKRVYQKTITTA